MRKLFLGAPILVWAVGTMTSCHTSQQRAAAPLPESEQIISSGLKNLYMASAAAPPQSTQKKKLILRMANDAANGKELMLTMRAAADAFDGASAEDIHSVVTAKMMKVATLDQLIDYEKRYEVAPASARLYVERMFELGRAQSDPRVWRSVRAAAHHLKLPDLVQAAQALAQTESPRP